MKFIIQDEERRANAIEYIKQFDISKPLEVFIKPYKKKRSNSQNNLYHMWLPILGEHFGYTHEEMHEELKIHFLGLEDKVSRKGIKYQMPKSTTKLNTKEFASYLNKVEILARNQEVILIYPDDYLLALMRD